MRKSLQSIQDFYENKDYRGAELRKILLKDKDYQKILKERKQKLTKKIKLTKSEKKKYIMSVDEDYEILAKVKQLEKLNTKKHCLTKEEKFLIRFVRTQLEHDWRKYIIKQLDRLLIKYKIKKH